MVRGSGRVGVVSLDRADPCGSNGVKYRLGVAVVVALAMFENGSKKLGKILNFGGAGGGVDYGAQVSGSG
jgi:hypothetical protein